MKLRVDDEWYTPRYAIEPLLPYLKPNSIIWCPFDTQDSQYVKVFKEHGHNVIFSHIDNGLDFLNQEVPECDYIISNPPFSKKNEVLTKLFSTGKPFAILMRNAGIFETPERWELFKNNKWELMIFDKRIKFSSPNVKATRPPFSSWYICSQLLPNQLEFVELGDI